MSEINIELQIRPRMVKVSEHYYKIQIFLEETLAFVLEGWYNNYQEAEDAAREYILERLC